MAFICDVLAAPASRNLLFAALIHDTGEQYTGDIPYPLKKQHPALDSYIKNAESSFMLYNGIGVELTEDEKQILKAADMLDLVFKCVEEMRAGNSHLEAVLETGITVLRGLTLPIGALQRLEDILKEIE